MKKKAVCLMIACLSLFAYPYKLKAGNEVIGNEKTEIVPPVLNPVMEKKVNEFKKHHPGIFSKARKNAAENSSAEGMKRDGGVIIISGGALLIIIILLILLL